jgi:hypothetical protein
MRYRPFTPNKRSKNFAPANSRFAACPGCLLNLSALRMHFPRLAPFSEILGLSALPQSRLVLLGTVPKPYYWSSLFSLAPSSPPRKTVF